MLSLDVQSLVGRAGSGQPDVTPAIKRVDRAELLERGSHSHKLDGIIVDDYKTQRDGLLNQHLLLCALL